MNFLIKCLAVGGAGAVGSLSRWLLALGFAELFGTAFPFGTFVINVTGSCFLGWFLTFLNTRFVPTETIKLAQVAIATGFVGAYTTFSTFMYESNSLLANGSELKAAANLLGSVLVGLLAVRLGIWIASR